MLSETELINTELNEVIGKYPTKFKDIFIQKFIELNKRTLSEDIETYEELRENAEDLRDLNKSFSLILSDIICKKVLRQLSLRGACSVKTFYNKIKDFNTNDASFKKKSRNLKDKIRDVCSSLLELEIIEKESLNIKPWKAIIYKSPFATPTQVEVAKEFYDEWRTVSDKEYIERRAELEAKAKIMASEKLKAYWESKKGTTDEMIKDAVQSEKKKVIKKTISTTIKRTMDMKKTSDILTCACGFKGNKKELGNHWAIKQVVIGAVPYCKACFEPEIITNEEGEIISKTMGKKKEWESPKPCKHNCQAIFNFNDLEATWLALNQVIDEQLPNMLKSQDLSGLLGDGGDGS